MAKFLIPFLILVLSAACSVSEKKKEQAELFLQNGTGHLTRGHVPQALSSLLHAEELDPSNPVIHNHLGVAYYMRREFELSEKEFDKALGLNGSYTDAKNNLGRLYIETGELDQAIKLLLSASKDLTYQTPEKVYGNLGLVYLRKGRPDQALKYLKQSLQLNNKFCAGHNYYGIALFDQKKYALATEFFERALALCDNNYDEAHYYSAVNYAHLGDIEKASARFEEVVRRYPASQFAEKARVWLSKNQNREDQK